MSSNDGANLSLPSKTTLRKNIAEPCKNYCYNKQSRVQNLYNHGSFLPQSDQTIIFQRGSFSASFEATYELFVVTFLKFRKSLTINFSTQSRKQDQWSFPL